MRSPQLVIVEADGWIARHLADIADEGAWLVRGVRGVDSARPLVRERRPCVLLVQVELAEDKVGPLQFIADMSRGFPDVPVIAVSDVKMNDADRVAWTATLFDLGARYVLFPPLTGPVLEDVVSGLMTIAIRRVVGDAPPPSLARGVPKPKQMPRREKPAEDVIDLADEGLHE